MISFSASFPVRKLRTSKKADSIWKLRTGKRSSDIATDVFDDDFNMYDVATVIDADDQIDEDMYFNEPQKRGADSWKLRTGKRAPAPAQAKRENLWHLRAGRK